MTRQPQTVMGDAYLYIRPIIMVEMDSEDMLAAIIKKGIFL